MSEKTHHVSGKKKNIAKHIGELIIKYPIIAAVDMENLPAPQLQQMREQLRGKIELTMTKRRIIKHAIEMVKDKKKGIEKLGPHLKGMPALIFTKENPFSLFKNLKKSKTSAPAKAGQTAPFDIIVPKGPTSFMPGPVIGELAELNIKSGVENGKVAIKADSIAVKEGEKISQKAAEILTRLGIEPMEVGLNITAVYENGDIFTRDVLDIDEDKFKANLGKAALESFNLAMNIEYPTTATINALIGKAFNDAKALGLSQAIIDEGIIDCLLSRAEGSALSLKSTANIEVPKKIKKEAKVEKKPKLEENKEEPKVEEKKPEPPKAEEKPKEPESKKEAPAPKQPEVREEPTPVEKREEKVLEEEKEIIKEEKRLEKSQESVIPKELEKKSQSEVNKPEIQTPVEQEVKQELKEEEEKVLENERIEKEKEFEKIEKKKEEPKKDDTDQKIAEMVAKTRKFVKGEIPNAETLVEEAGKLTAKETPAPKPKKIAPKAQNKIPTIQELQKKKEETSEEKEKKKKEQQDISKLTQELVKKGTLR